MASMIASSDSSDDYSQFLTLPAEIVRHIMSYFTYEEVSELRLVCKTFDQICQEVLNQGYHKVDRFHSQYQKELKARLPRRESERRNHPLSRHCDILAAIETRLSLLGMTFMKYVDMNLCCFIPGKVLDEITQLIEYIKKTPNPPRAHELLQELRDISSMAMEYFDEKIVPILRKKMTNSEFIIKSPCPGASTGMALGSSNAVARRQDVVRVQAQLKASVNNQLMFKKEFLEHRRQLMEQKKKYCELEKKLQRREQLISELNGKVQEQDRKMNEMNRKFIEYDHKFEDLTAEISKLSQVTTVKQETTLSRKRKTEDEEIAEDQTMSSRKRKPKVKKMKHCSN
ncbi:F-box only protein 28-like [Ptychodera flava]|uniref:F-box only protein 28-like n=1 Tax=Ptychodera flava TaxID=63121 RepID=UPI003969CA16